MSNVEFDTDQQHLRNIASFNQQSNTGGMAGWLVKKGIIKDESQARVLLMGIVIINFAIMAFLFYKYIL